MMNNSIGNIDINNIFGDNPTLDSISQDSGALDIFLSLSEFQNDRYDNDSMDMEDGLAFYSSSASPKLDPRTLVVLNETMQPDTENRSANTYSHQGYHDGQQRQQSSGRAESLGSISPLFGTTSCSHDLIGTHLNMALPSVPCSPATAEVQPSSSESGSPGATVYYSIAESPLRGRALDFRAFLKKKKVSTSIPKEGPAGVFVGQLPSTYSEEDTAALLRAIGADAGVEVHVRDVKSHNLSRTCAFVVVNCSALPVLLSYSKRILCDLSCVWVVERDQAAHLKDYINGFLRDRLRGVPKAALVLEELTPQYMRSRPFGFKAVKGGGRQPGNAGARQEGLFLASTTQDGAPVVGVQPLPMGMFASGWNPAASQSLHLHTMAGGSGGPQLVNAVPATNMYGVPQTNVFTALPSPSTVPPAPQLGFYVIAAAPPTLPQNGVHSLPQSQASNGKPHQSLSGNGSTGLSVSSVASDSRCHCADVPLFPHLYNRVPCSTCLAPISAMEAVYACPHDHSVTCVRCGSMRNSLGDAARAMGRVSPCITPQAGFGGFPQQPHMNSVFVRTLPPYPPQYGSQPSLTPYVSPQ